MSTEEKTGIFCDEIEKLFRAHKPQFVIWEQADEFIRQYARQAKDDLAGKTKAPPLVVNADQLILRDIQGHIRHASRARRIPYEAVPPKTWRAAILKNGNLGREEAKREAVKFCQMLRISVKNGDQAEAACLALFGATCQRFKWLNSETGKMEPLFAPKGAAA